MSVLTNKQLTRMERIYTIDELLSANSVVPLQAFLTRLGASHSTLNRDIRHMHCDRLPLRRAPP